MHPHRPSRLRLVAVLSLLGVASVASAQSTPQRTYILSGFAAATGDPLGNGTAACKATFTVTDTRTFRITSTRIQGQGREPDPKLARVDGPDGAGAPRGTAAQPDGSGWFALDHGHDGYSAHNGTWTAYVPKPRSPSGGILPCSDLGSTVRVIFPDAVY